MDSIGTIIITLALLVYTVGVWGIFFSKKLKTWHVFLFVLGVIFDIWGTALMYRAAGRFVMDLHGITGIAGIVLMLINAVWALYVLIKKDEKMINSFHKISVPIWILWLIPFFSPMFLR